MMKKIIFLTILGFQIFLAPFSFVAAEEDDFDFDSFATTDADSGEDMVTEPVSLNSGAEVVDVKQFDISGAMLGMSYDEINNLFFENSSLYAPRTKDSVVYSINTEWKYNLDYECRQNNIFIPEKIEKCIYSLARNRGLLYVSEIHLERTYTGETIDIYFTSNATDNVVWKIVYKNDVDNMEGTGLKFENQREKKILAFWQGVLDKYGTPNSDEDKWISSENSYDPMMKAYFGQLELIDNGINVSDYSLNLQTAREKFQAKPYAF